MLQFLLGPARSGKSSALHQRIDSLTREGTHRIFLLVPEQFTFETEKSLYRRLGGERFRQVSVTSFTRLAAETFRRYGGIAGRYADDCAKSVLMEMALDELRDSLDVYARSARSKGFSSVMLDAVTEFKNAGVAPMTLYAKAPALPNTALQKKMAETALIYQTYEALLKRSYLDPLDDVTRASEILRDTDFFDGALVFFDEFKGFTANENGFIRLILSRAEEVVVSLCLDPDRAGGEASPFASVREVQRRLTRFARQLNVPVRAPEVLPQSHFDAPELSHLEQNLMSPAPLPFQGENRAVQAVVCRNEYEEVDYVLSSIALLVREEGYTYDQIAILTRDLDTYRPRLEAGCRRYGIPCYLDQPAGIGDEPLIRFVKNALDCAVRGFTSENVVALLKSGVTPFPLEEVSALENYVYVWGVTGRRWRDPFTANPRGYQEAFTEEDAAVLAQVNRLREFAVTRLEAFRERLKDASGREICGAVMALLEEMQVRETLEGLIEGFYRQEDFAMAQEYGRVWELLMELLDVLASATSQPLREGLSITRQERAIRPEQFQRYFSLAVSLSSLGTLPQALDTVIAGSADRIRISGKAAVFILGVNENVLPFTPSESGIFTDQERELLIGAEIEIAKPIRERLKEERFIAYKALTAPSRRLCLTARRGDVGGNPLSPSGIFAELRRMFGPGVSGGERPEGAFYCQSPGSAFSWLARNCQDGGVFAASLKAVLREDPDFAPKVAGLDRVMERREFAIADQKIARALFGREMNLSPTRVEGFYQCRFRYFLEQGLRIRPLRKAELNPLETGVLIHQVLQAVTRQADLREGYDPAQVKAIIKAELDRYIETVMGGVQDKSSRFLYLYGRMRLSILKIVEQLHQELLQSRFEPVDFEYEIRPGGEVTPLRLLGEDGVVVNVAGKIDRVDVYVAKNGERYVRVVDYKSGRRQFKLADVLNGLSLQMLIYLQCICENGRGSYRDCLPAGILYMPAGESAPALGRDADPEEIRREQRKQYTMNGLLIEDAELLQAMDASMSGLFIPVTVKKDGDFTAESKKSLVTLEQLGKINAYIDRLILDMAVELRQGRIEAVPFPDSCGYCQYRGVCGVMKASRLRDRCDLDKESALRRMEESLDGQIHL